MVPADVRRLFWDVDPDTVDLERHRDYVIERVMLRGGWEPMRWLRATYSCDLLRDFLERKGTRIPPRERAYWSLVSGGAPVVEIGGGRPSWAGE